MLVPDRHYAAVSDWINGQHLGGRIVYYRVPQSAGIAAPPDLSGTTLSAKLTVRDSPFASWLERELVHRADLECVETMAEFRRVQKAITKAGQVKGAGGRHEKDDRYRIDDRSRYVLGWTNERKIEALLSQAQELSARIAKAADILKQHEAERAAAIERGKVLTGLEQTGEFAEIDYQSVVNRIAGLTDEHIRVTAASAELARLDAELKRVQGQITDAEREQSGAND